MTNNVSRSTDYLSIPSLLDTKLPGYVLLNPFHSFSSSFNGIYSYHPIKSEP